jgi:hypothetical protein
MPYVKTEGEKILQCIPRSFGSFLQIWNLDSRLGYVSSSICFSNLFGRQRKEDSNSRWTLSLILWFNLRLRGYYIWRAIFHRTPYEDYFWRLKSTRARAPRNLEAPRKILGKTYSRQSYEAMNCSGLVTEIDLRVPTRNLPARKEVVGLQLWFICNPPRTLPCNPTMTPTL